MHGMFFKVTGRYITAVALLFLVGLGIYLTLALPLGLFLFSLLSIVFVLLVLPFFATYEYMRYEDLYTVERTTEFAFIKGERSSIFSWAVVGASIMGINIFLGFYGLLPAQTREDIRISLVKGMLYTLAPAEAEMKKNTAAEESFFAKFRSEEKSPATLPEEGALYTPPPASKNYSDYNPSSQNQ